MALETLLALMPYAAPGTLNAVDDEANALITTGSAVFAPNLWGGSVWTAEKTNPQFYDQIGVDIVPKGTTPESDHRPIMGGLGLFIPTYSHNKDWAWQWIKFCCSKEIGKEWVEISANRRGSRCSPSTSRFSRTSRLWPRVSRPRTAWSRSRDG